MARHVVSSAFALLYALIAALVLARLALMLRGHAKMTGYLATFNYYTLAWAALRSTFWGAFALDASLPPLLYYLLFWLPLSLQYLTFALLASFLTKLTVGVREWRRWARRRVQLVLLVGGTAAVSGITLLAVLAAYVDADTYSRAQLLVSAALFLVLASAFVGISLALRHLAPSDYARMALPSPSLVLGITLTLALLFLSRCAYGVLSFSGIGFVDIDSEDFDADVKAAVSYGVWEFFPLLLLLFTLAAGERYNGSEPAVVGYAPTFGVFGAINALTTGAEDGGGGSEFEDALLPRRGSDEGSVSSGEGFGSRGVMRLQSHNNRDRRMGDSGSDASGAVKALSHLSLSSLTRPSAPNLPVLLSAIPHPPLLLFADAPISSSSGAGMGARPSSGNLAAAQGAAAPPPLLLLRGSGGGGLGAPGGALGTGSGLISPAWARHRADVED